MITRRILLAGSGARGHQVNARALRDLLDMVIAGSEKALRLLVQGRSRAHGQLPAWISDATEYVARIDAGCTQVTLEMPTLGESAPQLFEQTPLFDDAIDPEASAYDYLTWLMGSALSDHDESRYDRDFLQSLANFRQVFQHGITGIRFDQRSDEARQPIKLTPESLDRFAELAERVPDPRQVRIAGTLDTISHKTRTFVLEVVTDSTRKPVRGIVPPDLRSDLPELWGKPVLISGMAYFTHRGTVQRVEAEHIASANERELALWQQIPIPMGTTTTLSELRRPQGPDSGLNAIFGQWPGNESDEELIAALDELS